MSNLIRGLQYLSLFSLALLFVGAGINHFLNADLYLKIMPPMLPWPKELIYISGVFEVIGGTGILIPKFRRLFGWGLIALLIAVFPANIYMAIEADQFPNFPMWAILLRVPFQFVFIAWVYFSAIRSSEEYLSRH